MAINIDHFFLSRTDWKASGLSVFCTALVTDVRRMVLTLSVYEPPTVVFIDRNDHVGKIEYRDGCWNGDAPPWQEIYDLPALFIRKLPPNWQQESLLCYQEHDVDGVVLRVSLTITGMLLSYRGVVYTLEEQFPQEIMIWLLT